MILKLLILVGLGVAGYFIVKKVLAEESGGMDLDQTYQPPETPHPTG